MNKKGLILFVSTIMVCLLCFACSSTVSVEGTWYSVVDATMYNFKGGEITVAGVVVGQYENDADVVVVSLIDDANNRKLFITTLDGVEVLADVREGEGNIFFCRGIENAEAMVKEAEAIKAEAEKKRQNKLDDFPNYISEHLVGKWIPIKENADYQSIVITADGTLTFTKQNGDVWVQKLIFDENGQFQAENLRMEDRGYDSPTITLHMSDDGTDKNINKMSVFACRETYSEDYPALGFYGWTYQKAQ